MGYEQLFVRVLFACTRTMCMLMYKFILLGTSRNEMRKNRE